MIQHAYIYEIHRLENDLANMRDRLADLDKDAREMYVRFGIGFTGWSDLPLDEQDKWRKAALK